MTNNKIKLYGCNNGFIVFENNKVKIYGDAVKYKEDENRQVRAVLCIACQMFYLFLDKSSNKIMVSCVTDLEKVKLATENLINNQMITEALLSKVNDTDIDIIKNIYKGINAVNLLKYTCALALDIIDLNYIENNRQFEDFLVTDNCVTAVTQNEDLRIINVDKGIDIKVSNECKKQELLFSSIRCNAIGKLEGVILQKSKEGITIYKYNNCSCKEIFKIKNVKFAANIKQAVCTSNGKYIIVLSDDGIIRAFEFNDKENNYIKFKCDFIDELECVNDIAINTNNELGVLNKENEFYTMNY